MTRIRRLVGWLGCVAALGTLGATEARAQSPAAGEQTVIAPTTLDADVGFVRSPPLIAGRKGCGARSGNGGGFLLPARRAGAALRDLDGSAAGGADHSSRRRRPPVGEAPTALKARCTLTADGYALTLRARRKGPSVRKALGTRPRLLIASAKGGDPVTPDDRVGVLWAAKSS